MCYQYPCQGQVRSYPPLWKDIQNQLDGWLRIRFGQEGVEFHYLKIKPVIIAEEFLKDDDNKFSSSLVDYKVWCFNGKAFCIHTLYNRTSHHANFCLFDRNWNTLEDACIYTSHFPKGDIVVPKPENLDMLIEYAERLSAGHPQMRVDFYIVNGKIYFGELTMTSAMGYIGYFSQDFLLKMGMEARKGLKI